MATTSNPSSSTDLVLKVSKIQTTSENNQEILESCKSFFSHENREKVKKLCELEDLGKTGSVPLITFGRVLRYMGFRLLFEEIKKFVLLINVYNEGKDRVFYQKIVHCILRKLFRPKPYLFYLKPSQNQAASSIQKFYVARKNSWIRPGVRHPSVLMRELAKRLHQINKPLLKCFEQAEKNRCGYLEVIDIDQILRNHGIDANFEESREVFKTVDKRQAGKVNYDNFITAFESYFFALSKNNEGVPVSLQVKKIIGSFKDMLKGTKINCLQAFRMFDFGDKGVIAFDDFFEVISKIGLKHSQAELKQVFDYIDTGRDKFLSFIEFASAFYDLNESPIEILRRLEIEEQIRKEEEAKRLAEEERLRIIEEERKKIEDEEAKKKMEEEGKGKKAGKKAGKGSKGGGKAKTGKGETGKKEAKAGKKAGKGKGGKAKTGKKNAEPPPPPEPVIDENEIRLQELREMMRKEFLEQVISTALVQSDYMRLAKAGQQKLENRPVDKFCFTFSEDWTCSISNPMIDTLWLSPDQGLTGYIDQSGMLKTHDLLSGNELSVLHLGTKPPFEKIPILGGACDSKSNRIYILNKQWVLEVWSLHEKSTAPLKRVKVLSKVVGCDYVQKHFVDSNFDSPANLLSLSENGKIMVNSTCADGFIYCFEPVSLTLLWRSRLTLDEIKLNKAILSAYQEFEVFIQSCIKIGIKEEDLFKMLDLNGTGRVNFNDFSSIVQKNKLNIKEATLKNIFKTLDPKNLGFVYLDKLFAGKFLRNLEFFKDNLDMSKLLPDWVNNVHANEQVKDAMYRIYLALEKKNLNPQIVIEKLKTHPDFLPDDEVVPVEFFKETITAALAPDVKSNDLEIVVLAEDREGTGKINFVNFFGNLSSKKLSPSALMQLNSQSLPRDSLKYILHKSIELGVDLYKKCKELDTSASGTLPKETFASILLLMPIGLDPDSLSVVFDRDLTFNSIGSIDYLEIFERQEYFQLLISSKKSDFLTPPIQEESAVIQDFAFLEELSLLAFSSINPSTSTIFLKDLNGNLVCRLVGHFSSHPAVLHYCSRANALLSGETRPILSKGSAFDVTMPPCEILLWNLQLDLVDKFKFNPPWVVFPYKKVKAHEGTIRALNYLPITQAIVSTGSDGLVKVWSTTGLPFTLTEQEFIPLSEKVISQHTQTNQMITCVASFQCENCWKVKVEFSGNKEWALFLNNSEKTAEIKSLAFGRFKLVVPAKQHDWEIPQKCLLKVNEIFVGFRRKDLLGFDSQVLEKREELQKISKNLKNYEETLKKTAVKVMIYQEDYQKLIETIQELPTRKSSGQVTPAELYNVLVKYGGFHSVTFPKFLFLLNDIQEKKAGRKITNKDEAAVVSLIRSLEESKDEKTLTSLKNQIMEIICRSLKESNKSAFEVLTKLDSNQDKFLNMDEFSEFFKKIRLNLRKIEVASIMRTLDELNPTTVNLTLFHKKLEEAGYSDPFFTNFYNYLWEDSSITKFIRKFRKQHKFRNFFEFFSYFDSNNDGYLTSSELLEALSYVFKKQSERLTNIVITSLKNQLNCQTLGDFFETFSKNLPDSFKNESNNEAMEILISQFNSLQEIQNSVENLEKVSSWFLKSMNTGLEIHARKYRLRQGIKLLSAGKVSFQETLDKVLATSLEKMNESFLKNYEKKEFFVSGFDLEEIELKVFKAEDLQIVWDDDKALKEGEGKVVEDGKQVIVFGFSLTVLDDEVPGIGKYEDLLMKELKTTLKLQKLTDHIVKILGICHVENDQNKELWVIYEKPCSKNLKNIIESNGGLLQIPITHKLNAGKVIISYWAREILKILKLLQDNSIVMPYFSLENLYFSEDFSTFHIRLCNLSYVSSDLKISNILPLPDFLKKWGKKFEVSLAPEFQIKDYQNVDCQLWNFALTLLHMSLGDSPLSFSETFAIRAKSKAKTYELKKGVQPSKSFIYNPALFYEVQAGQVLRNDSYELGLIKTLASQSFSGIFSNFRIEKNLSSQLEVLKKRVKGKKEDQNKTEPLGDVFDLFSVCLRQNHAKRPQISALLEAQVLKFDGASEEQAKLFGKIVFLHKNPNRVISKFVTEKLDMISQDFNVSRADEVNEIISYLNIALLSYDDQVIKDTIEALNHFKISEPEKQEMIDKNLVHPTTELLNKCIQDQVFLKLSRLALLFSYKSEQKVLESYSTLLKALLEFINSVKNPNLKHSSHVIQAFFQLFTGQVSLSKNSSVLDQSYWRPEIFYSLSGLFKDIFGEEGEISPKFPGIKELLYKKFHPFYITELRQIFENLSILKNPESILFQKQGALKAFKETLKSGNEYRLKAALDSKFLQFVVSFLQDEEAKLRAEVLEIFFELSVAAKEDFLAEVPSVKGSCKFEDFAEFLVLSSGNAEVSLLTCFKAKEIMKDLSRVFESALFVAPVVRLIKLKSETAENKECAVRLLIFLLQGNCRVQNACLSPFTDTLSTICNTLNSFAKTVEAKTGKNLADVIQKCVEEFLATASPTMLKSFRLSPGADVVLKEQNLKVPDTISLSILLQKTTIPFTIDSSFTQYLFDLRNYMESVHKSTPESQEKLFKCLTFLQKVSDSSWNFIENLVRSGKTLSDQKKHCKSTLREIFSFFEFILMNDLDDGWMSEIDNIEWVVEKSLKSLEHSGSDYDSFPFENEGKICLKVFCRFLDRPKTDEILERLVFGKVFVLHFKSQMARLKEMMMKNVSALEVVEHNLELSIMRRKIFSHLVKVPQLSQQLIDHGLFELISRDYLPDTKTLPLEESEFISEFISCQMLFPIRGEAIFIIKKVFKYKETLPKVFQNLTENMKTHRVVSNEIKKIQDYHLLSISAIDLLHSLIKSAEDQFSALLMQAEAAKSLSAVLSKTPKLREKFPGLSEYSA